ncbi:MAG: cupin domain-containing protein [Acidobacteriota bacterium]|nr:cupin domain-containing protein [Acidobacteriota bacterium]
MAIVFNESEVTPEVLGDGIERQKLLTRERVAGTSILLDRLKLAAGASLEFAIDPQSVAWFQVLTGEGDLKHARGSEKLSDAHVAVLPPGFRGTFTSQAGASLLYAEVPNATRFDGGLATHPPEFRVVDWTREPVLQSEHDARKRIYLVTPKLFGMKAIKGEMIIYPKGTTGANHHHEGAEHFMYFLRGSGTAHANEKPFPVRKGDVVHYPDRERHYLSAADNEEMVFVEFFAPGECVTVWVDENKVCAWLPTGLDIQGNAPVREIKGHSSKEVAIPQDV